MNAKIPSKSKEQKSTTQFEPSDVTRQCLLVAYPESYDIINLVNYCLSKQATFFYILHDQDDKKEHWHALIRFTKPTYIGKVAKDLGLGLNYFEKVKTNVQGNLKYFLHLTKESLADGKYQYQRNDIFTNLTDAELDRFIDAVPDKALGVLADCELLGGGHITEREFIYSHPEYLYQPANVKTLKTIFNASDGEVAELRRECRQLRHINNTYLAILNELMEYGGQEIIGKLTYLFKKYSVGNPSSGEIDEYFFKDERIKTLKEIFNYG